MIQSYVYMERGHKKNRSSQKRDVIRRTLLSKGDVIRRTVGSFYYNNIYKKTKHGFNMKAREFAWMIVISLVFALIITLLKSLERFLYILLVVFAIILINFVAKKIMAFYLESEIEIKLWEIQRYGFKPSSYFKKPFPAGIAFSLVIGALTLGNVPWMASLVFDVKPKTYRAAKRHGLYSFSEMTERHIGLIASTGIIISLICAGIAYLAGVPDFAKLSIIFVFFNMLPLSDLDGNKIFFGNIVLWSFLAVVTLIGLGYALLMI